jgi:hypothetical protein
MNSDITFVGVLLAKRARRVYLSHDTRARLRSIAGPRPAGGASGPRALSQKHGTTHSKAELGEKQLGFGGVLVFCDRVSVSLLDKSVGNQAIESQAFICTQILDLFQAPSGYNIAKERQFFVGNRVGVCHLIAPYELPDLSFGFTLGSPHTKCCGSQQKTNAQTSLALLANCYGHLGRIAEARLPGRRS